VSGEPPHTPLEKKGRTVAGLGGLDGLDELEYRRQLTSPAHASLHFTSLHSTSLQWSCGTSPFFLKQGHSRLFGFSEFEFSNRKKTGVSE
jgi:hypothetical protein